LETYRTIHDAGPSMIDTAEIYFSERVVGDCLRAVCSFTLIWINGAVCGIWNVPGAPDSESEYSDPRLLADSSRQTQNNWRAAKMTLMPSGLSVLSPALHGAEEARYPVANSRRASVHIAQTSLSRGGQNLYFKRCRRARAKCSNRRLI
jgi:hypothetical protein